MRLEYFDFSQKCKSMFFGMQKHKMMEKRQMELILIRFIKIIQKTKINMNKEKPHSKHMESEDNATNAGLEKNKSKIRFKDNYITLYIMK